MFDNIGGKLKALAKVLCWIGMIISVISGLAAMFSTRNGAGFFGGLIAIVIGCLLSWIGSFFTYGFGQLIENTESMNYKMGELDKKLEKLGQDTGKSI